MTFAKRIAASGLLAALVGSLPAAADPVHYDLDRAVDALTARWERNLAAAPAGLTPGEIPVGLELPLRRAGRYRVSTGQVHGTLRDLAARGYGAPFVATLAVERDGDTAMHYAVWSLSRVGADGAREIAAGRIRHDLRRGPDGRWYLSSVAWSGQPGGSPALIVTPGDAVAADLIRLDAIDVPPPWSYETTN